MILVDTSIWIDYLRAGNAVLTEWLARKLVLMHPFVIGELSMGSIGKRHTILRDLADLPASVVAENAEVQDFIERFKLYGRGIGYIDAHLLASSRLTRDAKLWTRDKRLREIAEAMSLAAFPS